MAPIHCGATAFSTTNSETRLISVPQPSRDVQRAANTGNKGAIPRAVADHVVIEDASSGMSLEQDFHAERRARGRDAFTPYMAKPWASKKERLIGQTGQLEAGLCVLPNEAPWFDAFIAELRAFPGGRHDDQVDALSQLLEFAMNSRAWLHEPGYPVTGRKLINRPSRIIRTSRKR